MIYVIIACTLYSCQILHSGRRQVLAKGKDTTVQVIDTVKITGFSISESELLANSARSIDSIFAADTAGTAQDTATRETITRISTHIKKHAPVIPRMHGSRGGVHYDLYDKGDSLYLKITRADTAVVTKAYAKIHIAPPPEPIPAPSVWTLLADWYCSWPRGVKIFSWIILAILVIDLTHRIIYGKREY